MKKTLVLAALAAATLLGGCTTRTKYGKCVGILDKEDPAFEYDTSGFNLVMDFIFSETIVVPAVGLLAEFKCPEAPARAPASK